MKRIIIVLLGACLILTACASPKPAALSDDLELSILQDVGSGDMSAFNEKYGMFGGRQYVPVRYELGTDEAGQQRLPAKYVLYTVTAWPDHRDGGSFVTNILITDPAVHVFGVTVNASAEEFIAAAKAFGLKKASRPPEWDKDIASRFTEFACVVSRDRSWYAVLEANSAGRSIQILAPVSNTDGIVF